MISWWPAAGNGNDIAGTNHGSLANGLVCSPGEVGSGSTSMARMIGSSFLIPRR